MHSLISLTTVAESGIQFTVGYIFNLAHLR